MAEDHFPAILGLIGTLSGTAVGFAGGFVGQWLLEGRKQNAEKKKKKAEKLEELSALLADSTLHLQLFEGYLNSGDAWSVALQKLPPNPFSKLIAISDVYFPEFQAPLDELMKLASDFLLCVHELQKEGEGEDIEALYARIGKAHDTLAGAVRNYAKHEFQ
jgi:hypothetical protein